jgi:hypothetical protein
MQAAGIQTKGKKRFTIAWAWSELPTQPQAM